jgi:hypothetical protein
MGDTYFLPIEVYDIIFDILSDNVINIVSLVHVNQYLHRIVSMYAKSKAIVRRPDCKYAVITNRIEILTWAISLSFPIDRKSCLHATKQGNLDMLAYVIDNGCGWSNDIFYEATLCGKLEIVKWCYDYVSRSGHLKQLLDPSLCDHAAELCDYVAKGGNLDVLIFLKEKCFPKWLKEQNCECGKFIYTCAMLSGNINVLNWLKNNT